MQQFSFEFLLIFEVRPERRTVVAGADHNRIEIFALRFVGIQIPHGHRPSSGRIIIVRLLHFNHFGPVDEMLGQIKLFDVVLEVFELPKGRTFFMSGQEDQPSTLLRIAYHQTVVKVIREAGVGHKVW